MAQLPNLIWIITNTGHQIKNRFKEENNNNQRSQHKPIIQSLIDKDQGSRDSQFAQHTYYNVQKKTYAHLIESLNMLLQEWPNFLIEVCTKWGRISNTDIVHITVALLREYRDKTVHRVHKTKQFQFLPITFLIQYALEI